MDEGAYGLAAFGFDVVIHFEDFQVELEAIFKPKWPSRPRMSPLLREKVTLSTARMGPKVLVRVLMVRAGCSTKLA